MKAREICLYLALGTGFVFAQSDNKPEIRGAVTDPSLNIGVAGAEITLFEFLLNAEKTVVRTKIATTSTDTRGEFRFPLDHFGEYLVEAKKEGYSVPSVMPEDAFARADVNFGHPTQDLRFSLSLPGDITGRVVDEDGNPVAGQRIGIQANGSEIPPDLAPRAVTDQTGAFTTGKLPAGQYLVHLSAKEGDFESVTTKFSDEDLKIVDQDFDSAPGPPVPVSPGATSSVGTITVRKVPYYRAHVTVRGVDCEPREGWMFSAIPKAPPFTDRYLAIFPCANEFLIRNLKPGSYWFALRSDNPNNGKWALADAVVSRENVEVSLPMSQAAELSGRIVAAEGVTLPKFQQVTIMMRARLGSLLGWAAAGIADSEGKFVFKNLPWLRHDVSVRGFGGRYYIKEVRYNGVAMADDMVTPVPGAPAQNLEIVLDDQPATITGSVRDGDKPVSGPLILAVKWPFTQGDVPISGDGLKGDQAGHFQLSGLAPGEYRVIALSKFVRFDELSSQLLSRAETVTLERGNLKDVSLKLIDPSQ